jgi:hypothetical protein
LIYSPAIKEYQGKKLYKAYIALTGLKTTIFVGVAILTFISPSMITLVAGFAGYVIIFLVATTMKTLRESMKDGDLSTEGSLMLGND